MKRRRFLATTLAAATAPLLRAAPAASGAPGGLIDTNVTLGHWAIRRSWAGTPARLAAKLRQHGVSAAWAGSFDGVLQTDLAAVNARLAESCAQERDGLLRPFGTVNPAQPDWEDDIRRCHEAHRMPGLRLFPNYHGYTLDDPRFARLLDLAGQRGLLVQIALSIEDERSQNPVLAAAPVVVAPLVDLVQKFSRARVMLLNGSARVLGNGTPLFQRLVAAGIYFETAMLEGVAGIEAWLRRAPGVRLAFGSHAPYFYFESALLKLQESALSPEQLAAVCHGHARAALPSP